MIRRPPRSTLFPYTPLSRSDRRPQLPVAHRLRQLRPDQRGGPLMTRRHVLALAIAVLAVLDRKSTRLNSSHANISYAVFCLKKKIQNKYPITPSRPALPHHV